MLDATWFDGINPRPQAVRLQVAQGHLVLHGEGFTHQVPLADVEWPETQRHGQRVAHFSRGGNVVCTDGVAFDALAREAGRQPGLVVRSQQSWRGVAIALVMLAVLGMAGYLWGVPLAARGVMAVLPVKADRALGEAVLARMEGTQFQPTALPIARRQALNERFQKMVAAAPQLAAMAPVQLHFRRSTLGPNALAFPGGHVVLTDELVALAGENDDMVLGVLAHELGHVQNRHSMRMLVQASVIGAATSVALGDFSSVLATAPAILGQLAYSRQFEREADEHGLAALQAQGIAPAVMVEFFDRIEAWQRKVQAPDGGHLLSSHPVHEARRTFFRTGRWP